MKSILKDAKEVIYDETLRLYEIQFKNLDSSKNKAYRFMGFSGVIINLILLVAVQVISFSNTTSYLLLLIPAGFFIFLSLLTTIPVITSETVYLTDTQKLIKDFKDESDETTILSLSTSIAASNDELTDKLKENSKYLNISLIFLILGAFFVLMFTILFIGVNLK